MKVISLNKYLFPIGLAAILTFLIFIIAPPVNKRLNINLVDTKVCNENQFYFYEDLDGDGITEEYRSFNNSAGSAAIDGSFMNRKYLA